MEKVICHTHGSICMLKTGVKDGPNKDKSFYVCVDKLGCGFSHVTPSHCLHHEESVVELQALSYSQQKLFYRCVLGKKAGQRWCGNVPWSMVRFCQSVFCYLLSPDSKALESGKMQHGGHEEKSTKVGQGVVEAESHQKENLENPSMKIQAVERKLSSSDTYQNRQLPPGMKVKKRVSNEESSLNNHSVELLASNLQDKTEKESKERGKGQNWISNVKSDCAEIPNLTSAEKHSPKQSNEGAACALKQEELSENTSNSTSDSSSQQMQSQDDKKDEDDVILLSVHPAVRKPPAVSSTQKTLTAFPGFQLASEVKGQGQDPKNLHLMLTSQLQQKKATLSVVNVAVLPDKGERLKTQVKELEEALKSLSFSALSQTVSSNQVNPFARHGGTILLPAPPAGNFSQHPACGSSLELSQGYTKMYGANPQSQAFYGGRMTEDRMLAVKNATCEAIDHLHKSLESCPNTDTEVPDPKAIKVPLLPHQRRALAWLLWRETQKPCGGILADDMGLGKTLTMVALILGQKSKAEEEDGKKKETKLKTWISKTDSSLVLSKGTLIICPASLVHHWKREIDRHIKKGKLTVYLYHGPNREKSAKVLADYDVVVTTYSLVSKEGPVLKEAADKPTKDSDDVSPRLGPLLRVAWARLVLDEAHNIKNPKVQTSMAVCQLRASARWAVTGTPIQNNLLDMYSLLKFLRCSPFDEYKLWKAQVDNGSRRGRERLNLLTNSLLLRRTKDQLDSAGKPLVSLPKRTCEVHRLKLSEDEQAVYDVVFTQSRSTLQNYLKRHEGNDIKQKSCSSLNPFEKVAQEFGMSQGDGAVSSPQQPQQASSTVHILSLLLRLRQCCCHISLLKKTLDSSELMGDGIVLSLEEQLNALSLSSSPSSDPKDTVTLNGTRFSFQLFEETCKSTKVSTLDLKQTGDDQKSVIVSQWTSMLHIVGVHLKLIGLKYAVIDGTVNPKRRMDLVEEFNTNPKGPQVMLVSLCAGGVGLNLIGGNHLFLLDMHWNPALEDQACDRIYRVGQLKDVTIHRFVCEGTVEEKITALQTKKKDLAQNVLSGAGNVLSKLTLADLRVIFGV
uniref:Transcription termination factor 2 n=1 Tax=Gouania willdenowi TaxID=441366 RepID=A0A8C5E590_GOUWI